eukprot:1181833-Prorocentrum_minimum.AAC.4
MPRCSGSHASVSSYSICAALGANRSAQRRTNSGGRASALRTNAAPLQQISPVPRSGRPRSCDPTEYMLSSLPRLAPATGTFSLPFRDWRPLRVCFGSTGWLVSIPACACVGETAAPATRRRFGGTGRFEVAEAEEVWVG